MYLRTCAGEDPFVWSAIFVAGNGLRRLNKISKDAEADDAFALCAKTTLQQLAQRARLAIDTDNLLTPDDKKRQKAWLIDILQNQNTLEDNKKLAIATYLLTEKADG